MAKVTRFDLNASVAPLFKGRFYVQFRNGQAVACKWHAGMPTNKSPARWFYEQQFALASSLASSATSLDLDTATFLTKTTPNPPRDFLTQAAYGRLYVIKNPDGTEWPQADHSYVPPADDGSNTGDDENVSWEYPAGQPTGINNRQYVKWMGNIIQPDIDLQLSAVRTYSGAEVPVTMVMRIYQLNEYNEIVALLHEKEAVQAIAYPNATQFAVSQELGKGVRYAILCTPKDLAISKQWLVKYGQYAYYRIPVQYARYGDINVLDPQPGQTIRTIGDYTMAMGLRVTE